MSANVGTLVTGAVRRPNRWKAILIGAVMAAALTAGAVVLTRPSAPAPVVEQNGTTFILPAVPQSGSQFGSTESRHPERARRKFGGLPAPSRTGPFDRRKWGW